MRRKTIITAIFGLAVIGLLSCEKDDLNNATVQLEFNTVTTESGLKSAAANSIMFSEGHIILESIEFETETDSDSTAVEFEIESYITLDFATGETSPDLSAIQIAPGLYTEIEIEFELWDGTEQASIDLTGTWTDADGAEHPVRLLMPLGQEFSLEIEGEFTVEENTSMVAQVTFDPNSWFLGEAGNLLSTAVADEDGVIVISPDQNSNIYDIIEDAIDNTSEVEIEM
ncbi:MAG: hypothetical protein R6V34_05815 [Bacteroidales bacterium]